jgi:(2Fe-2S) ferredoxin
MPKLMTAHDLDLHRDAVQRERTIEAATGTIITIGLGTCGIAAGARETLAAIHQELAQRRIDAQVRIVGCIGICVKEPLVDIQQAGKSRITYANVTPQMVPQLIEEHLLHGRPVKQWVVGRIPAP